MRISADENCDMLLVGRLRAAGHDVARVVDQASGASDEAVLELAAAQDRILLTHDLDFGLLSRSQQLPPSVVLIRLDPLTTQTRADIVAAYFPRRMPASAVCCPSWNREMFEDAL